MNGRGNGWWVRTTAGARAFVRESEHRLLVDTVILGVFAALVAQVYNAALQLGYGAFLGRLAGYTPPGLPSEGGATEHFGPYGLWLVPLSTTLGGLIVGIITERFAPETEGHGTDAALKAFHRQEGKLRARVAPIKLLTSAITIGSGGSAGREGPMALISAGFGSTYATLLGRDSKDRRTLLLVGIAAGISAIFRSPIGAAILAVELPYADMEFEPGALLYTAIGAVVAFAVNGMFVGYAPLFSAPANVGGLQRTIDYIWYVPFGVAAGLFATVMPEVFYHTAAWFKRLPLPAAYRPALGGLITGLIALAVPQILGGGYGWMQMAIDGRLALGLLFLLAFVKLIALSATVGSGGSGGVFAPALFMGAMLGAGFAQLIGQPSAPFAIVGMAAVFAGAAHVPIAAMMMVTEMTGGYTLLVPATLAVMISYLVQGRLSRGLRYRSVYSNQVASRAESPAHHEKHLQIAMQILRDRGLDVAATGDAENTIAALSDGRPITLHGGRRVLVGVLRAESALAGATLESTAARREADGLNIVSVIRGEHMLAPRADLRLLGGDRLVLIVDEQAKGNASEHVAPW
ncbi:MAG: chloride channel protein [Proteobacteria bacterium]|nr:chloride channel protein [Pseudomonadota bacterium]